MTAADLHSPGYICTSQGCGCRSANRKQKPGKPNAWTDDERDHIPRVGAVLARGGEQTGSGKYNSPTVRNAIMAGKRHAATTSGARDWLEDQRDRREWIADHAGELLGVAIDLGAKDPEDVVHNSIMTLLGSETWGNGIMGLWPFAASVVRSRVKDERRTRKRTDVAFETLRQGAGTSSCMDQKAVSFRDPSHRQPRIVMSASSDTCWLARQGWAPHSDERAFAQTWVEQQRKLFRYLLRRDRFGIEPATATP